MVHNYPSKREWLLSRIAEDKKTLSFLRHLDETPTDGAYRETIQLLKKRILDNVTKLRDLLQEQEAEKQKPKPPVWGKRSLLQKLDVTLSRTSVLFLPFILIYICVEHLYLKLNKTA